MEQFETLTQQLVTKGNDTELQLSHRLRKIQKPQRTGTSITSEEDEDISEVKDSLKSDDDPESELKTGLIWSRIYCICGDRGILEINVYYCYDFIHPLKDLIVANSGIFFNLLLVLTSSSTNRQRTRVIKVVPHNPRLATESAARIFRSIQEERKQYDWFLYLIRATSPKITVFLILC
ncbi:uncharacterized protein LOC111274157 [Durio zibethinus]|uniref:Uncharacterized protein LOC111274157 n=1 Tax=Durio zibethinus TaxID=66656 RepID=A0A6P5WES1_DURZI|nr:uncharacterized protein LOC111274157 [Durio zibethinus]